MTALDTQQKQGMLEPCRPLTGYFCKKLRKKKSTPLNILKETIIIIINQISFIHELIS